MVENPDEFTAITLDKGKSGHTNERIVIDNQQIIVVSFVKRSGLQLDDKLKFNLNICNICKYTASQLNLLISAFSWLAVYLQMAVYL